MELQREREAITMGILALEKSPDGPNAAETLWMIGFAYVLLDNDLDAREYFDRIVREYPQSDRIDGALYYQAMGELESRRGNKTKALSTLTRICRNYPNGNYWSHAAWELAYQSYLRKDYATSDMYLQQLLSHPPDEAVIDRALFLKGQLAIELKQWNTALVAFDEVGKIVDSPLRPYAGQAAAVARGSVSAEIRR